MKYKKEVAVKKHYFLKRKRAKFGTLPKISHAMCWVFYSYFFYNILKVFIIIIKVTPTSAKMACHMFEIPSVLRIKTKIFIPIANIRFCLIILLVFLEILMLLAICPKRICHNNNIRSFYRRTSTNSSHRNSNIANS